MIPTKAIELAKKGGFQIPSYIHPMDYETAEFGRTLALSKDFWVCLGKELGLGKCSCKRKPIHDLYCKSSDWKWFASLFLDLILTEQDTTEFWASILPDTQKSL